jgi:hypothetical protein
MTPLPENTAAALNLCTLVFLTKRNERDSRIDLDNSSARASS